MKDEKYQHSEVTDKILKSFYEVYNKIGIGFEKGIYVNSLMISMRKGGLKSAINKEIPLYYEG